ncbi:Uncharacterized protein YnzC, UPF0291/DUF896 family [Dendrosporobacter quercicolus]|uniref:UPF0291 protein SAMN04488502_10350 n=1 Tax=Dendrosporobacter quercicolus TaxID=146817 RepID=A0A1G9RNC1_9FIRM|nr:DUF896 domain-containing protein [Dendrosporobacter quercicolus]SDM24799.1 Uncharacterized protein YnzC, UPF0291/DUF896 family [Dendrosporobacter quercicolus]
MTPEIISRINALAKKQRECGLNQEECAEQAKLRRIYIDNIKAQLKTHLDCIETVPRSTANEWR